MILKVTHGILKTKKNLMKSKQYFWILKEQSGDYIYPPSPFFQPLPYLGTHFQTILYHDQDQQYDPLVNEKVLMKFQSTTHPKY